MAETEVFRISKVVKELGVGLDHVKDFLSKHGITDINPNSKITSSEYALLNKEFATDKSAREEAKSVAISTKIKKEEAVAAIEEARPAAKVVVEEKEEILIRDNSLKSVEEKPKAVKKAESEPAVEEKKIVTETKSEDQIKGPTVVGKINLDSINSKTKPGKKSKEEKEAEKTSKKETESPKKKSSKKETETNVPETPVVAKEQVETNSASLEAGTEESPLSPEDDQKEDFHTTQYHKLEGPTILGKINLPIKEEKKKQPPVASSNAANDAKKKRKRIKKSVNPNESTPNAGGGQAPHTGGGGYQGKKPFAERGPGGTGNARPIEKNEVSEEEIQRQIKETLARLSGAGKSSSSKHRRDKRADVREKKEEEAVRQEAEDKVIKVTEFVSANEMAKMMNVSVNNIISTCMSLGMFVSINQRLDAETIAVVAEEFGYQVQFVKAEESVDVEDVIDNPEDLVDRAPIVTVMGHVDHGKTSLLDYIRSANVIAGEAGGITQHIGAYSVDLASGKRIAFLDTPGHEAFTAMRARGAQVTDIVIIVVAADDNVMPQTKEAITHAQAAGVPIVFAINKIDKPGANPDKIREELSAMNILVEEWGGKYQCQEISAKKGTNIDLLLEKVLLEAEMLELKANPNRNAIGTVIESSLDKGKGYVATVLVAAGTLKTGDVILAGGYSGRVKALADERGKFMKSAGPSMPAVILGLSGAPQAGDQFKVMDDERQAREIATRRLQLQREQGIRTHKHITLDEIGRRLAIGDFKQLNLIIKGDVDGSVEALTDSLLKLSTEKISVNVVMKAVGPVSESDVLLASASDAIIVAFNVRPSVNARKLAEEEEIQIKSYSIIYAAIDEIKAAMEGMLAPQFEEKIICNIEIRDVFKITKVGTIAGCMVLDGKVERRTKIRVIRGGIVIHTGELGSLKRFKDDVKEVSSGYECGLNIEKFNDIEVGDIIEGYEMTEVKAKL